MQMKMRILFLFTLVLAFSIDAAAQGVAPGFDLSNYGVRIEPDKRVMVVLAALEMAETKNEAGTVEKLIKTPLSDKGTRFREQLLADNADLDAGLRQRISIFVSLYKKRHQGMNDVDLIAPFISMALTLTPVPELADPSVTTDLPASLLDVLDFAPLTREFYRRSTIAARLDDYVKAYRAEADGVLRTSAREMVSELLDYLHTKPQLYSAEKVKVQGQKTNSKQKIEKTEVRTHERHFNIVPEMLAPHGSVDFLNARDDYFVILPPDKDLSFSDVRRAYLQFVIDPIVLGNSRDIAAISAWVKPQLDEMRKTRPSISPDVVLTISRSLTAAVDVREAEYVKGRIATEQSRKKIDVLKTDAEKRAVSADLERYKQTLADESALRLYEDYQKGLVLSFFFSNKLKEIEESGVDLGVSLNQILASFDATKEINYVDATADARKRALAARDDRKKNPDAVVTVAENPVTVRLREIQKAIDAKDYVKAAAELKQLQSQHPAEPRIYYNIGRVTSLIAAGIENEDAQAEKLMQAKAAYNAVITNAKPDTDPVLLSLTYVALARIYEHFGNNDYAIKLYDQAIKLGKIGSYREAMDSKQRLIGQH